MGEILLPLSRPSIVTSLVLRTHQAVGTPRTFSGQVQVTAVPSDGVLYVPSPSFWSLKNPALTLGIGQKTAQFTAMRTRARDRAGPCPIVRRLQWFRNTAMQVLQDRRAQALDCRHGLRCCLPDETQDSRNE